MSELAMGELPVIQAQPRAVSAIRAFFAKHPHDEVIAPYIAATCGLDVLPALAALCVLLEMGEIQVDVGQHTWTWQLRRARRLP